MEPSGKLCLRDQILLDVAQTLLITGVSPVNVLLFDSEVGGRLLTQEVWEALSSGRHRLRVYAPTMNGRVMARLRALNLPPGTIMSGLGCYHVFLQHWAPHIRENGRLHIIMADAKHDGVNGTRDLLEHLARADLLAPVGCRVTFSLNLDPQKRRRSLTGVGHRLNHITASSDYHLTILPRHVYPDCVLYRGRIQKTKTTE